MSKECEGNGNGIWKTIKSLFDNKSSGSVDNVVLCDNGTSDKSNEVPTVFNEHFVNVARVIGQVDTIPDEKAFEAVVAKHKNHPVLNGKGSCRRKIIFLQTG